MEIRTATIKDIPQIKKLNKFNQILKKCSPLDQLDPNYKEEKDYYQTFIRGKNKWCYLAEENNKLLGFILFNIENREPFWKIKKVGSVDLLFVAEKVRKKGISKLLMNKADQIFKKKNLPYIKLSVQTDNQAAHTIWKKHGFKDFRADMYRRL